MTGTEEDSDQEVAQSTKEEMAIVTEETALWTEDLEVHLQDSTIGEGK